MVLNWESRNVSPVMEEQGGLRVVICLSFDNKNGGIGKWGSLLHECHSGLSFFASREYYA